MRKLLGLVCVLTLCYPLSGETTPKKVYVNVHSDRSDTQIGIVDGVISLHDSSSGQYRRYIVRKGKIDKQIVLNRKEKEKESFVGEQMGSAFYCPYSHPGMMHGM